MLMKNDEESDVGEKSLRYLNELNIYLNGRCGLNCPHYDTSISIIKTAGIENYQITPIYKGKNITFFYLCPPPSNYETAIGQPDLCSVKP
jgi:hypothetical protein